MNENGFHSLLVTGGAGYVGSALVPALLQQGYKVKVIDLFWYGTNVFGKYDGHPNLQLVELDIRDRPQLRKEVEGTDALIHLACISNDPSFELNPALGKSINLDAFEGLIEAAAAAGVRRFLYASSSSIYGLKKEPAVHEETKPEPLTDYSRYKLQCEQQLLSHPAAAAMEKVILRPATVCGYAPRLRLDLTVNILTIHALVNRKIRIFGGKQLRPNLNIHDMVRAYQHLLQAPSAKIDGQAFNVGFENRSVEAIAHLVRDTLNDSSIELEYVPSSDLRSYHVDSGKIRKALGFETVYTIEEAVRSLAEAYTAGWLKDPMANPFYSNIRRMQQLQVH